jgi:hypothetical protein
MDGGFGVILDMAPTRISFDYRRLPNSDCPSAGPLSVEFTSSTVGSSHRQRARATLPASARGRPPYGRDTLGNFMPFLFSTRPRRALCRGGRFAAEVAAVSQHRRGAHRAPLRYSCRPRACASRWWPASRRCLRCCAVLDDVNFGLRAGDNDGTSPPRSARGAQVRHAACSYNHCQPGSRFADHAPKTYGVESYIAVPLRRQRNPSPFGVLCALDPSRRRSPRTRWKCFPCHSRTWMGYQLEHAVELDQRDAQLLRPASHAALREQLIGIVMPRSAQHTPSPCRPRRCVRRVDWTRARSWGPQPHPGLSDRANGSSGSARLHPGPHGQGATPSSAGPWTSPRWPGKCERRTKHHPRTAINHYSEGKGEGRGSGPHGPGALEPAAQRGAVHAPPMRPSKYSRAEREAAAWC